MLPNFGATQTVSPFPNPPEYASAYTWDRIDNGSAPPPPHPLTEFKVFGEEYRLEEDVIAPLSTAGVEQYYVDKNNWKAEMKKLNRSAIAAFFDLLEILIRAPDHPARDKKMVDLHTIFINMHHLINEFRPVQARDSVRILQERQIDELTETCDEFRKYLAYGREVVEDQFKMITGKLPPPPPPSDLTRVRMQNGALHRLIEVEKEPEEDEEMKVDDEEQEPSTSSKGNQKTLRDMTKGYGPPSVVNLLARQLNEMELKK
ncbi:hypothetical protein B9Z55_003771 [Caenorhabditis nigoni]|uniref:Mediator of RNA polymerase II transcription subunit 7 n=2 Tax=Caenorhabditis nigoni TaxID=1611254 RepID=A0A2G5VS04_9PELO|nr:hypothetical protein B9Z55_003771 [Caenorhabditis nigoni]